MKEIKGILVIKKKTHIKIKYIIFMVNQNIIKGGYMCQINYNIVWIKNKEVKKNFLIIGIVFWKLIEIL